MAYLSLASILLAFSAPLAIALLIPLPYIKQPSTNFSLPYSNSTDLSLLGSWPPAPYTIDVTALLTLTVRAYGRAPAAYALIPTSYTLAFRDIAFKLAPQYEDEPIQNLNVLSYNQLIRVRFSSPEKLLMRSEAPEIWNKVWFVSLRHWPREILIADIFDKFLQTRIGRFTLAYPGPFQQLEQEGLAESAQLVQ